MHAQTHHREERLLHAVPDIVSEVIAVVVGEGNRRLFESLGATSFVEGGQTMNPATSDLVAAVERTGATEAILLPNNSNVIMSAEQAARLASKPVEVVASDSIPAGLAAMVSFDPQRSAGENAEEMREAVGAVATGEVTIASRDAKLNGLAVPKGSWLGLADGEAIAVGDDFEHVVGEVVERLLAEPRGVLTLLRGEDAPDVDALVAADRHAPPRRRGRRARRRPAPLPAPPLRRVSGNGPIRVVLVEDNQVFREALELLLGLQQDIDVVASVADGSDAVPACREHRPDVVVMDYRLPGLDGVQATKAVLASCPGTAVVVLTASANGARDGRSRGRGRGRVPDEGPGAGRDRRRDQSARPRD